MPIRKQAKGGHRGKVLLSVQLVPAELVGHYPAGSGRSDPNANPHLPKPTGRLQFSLNPFRMLYRLIGPKYCRTLTNCFCCAICLVVAALILYYMVPVIFGNVITAPISG